MVTPWNPNDPEAVGPEFLPELTRSWTVGSTGGANAGITQRFRSTATEADPEVSVFASAVTGSGYLMAEVVADGNEDWPGLLVSKIQPATAVAAGNFRNQAGSSTLANLIASIDETTDPSAISDYIEPTVRGVRQYIDLQFSAAQITAACAGKRVLGVSLGVRTRPTSAGDLSDLYWCRIIDLATGDVVRRMDKSVPANTEAWWNLGELATVDSDPDAALPYDETQLLELATGGGLAIRLGCSGGDGVKIGRVRLAVACANEERLGVAVLNHGSWDLSDDIVGNGNGNWSTPVDLDVPDSSGDGWAKTAATTYRMIYRRAFTGDLANSLNVTLPLLSRHDSATPPVGTYLDDPLLLVARTVVGPNTASVMTDIATIPRIGRTPTGAAVQPVGVLPVRFLVGGVDSVDGQPYARLAIAAVDAVSGPVRQYVTTGAGGDYSALRLVLGVGSNTPTADLTVDVQNAAGTVTLGTGSISAAAYAAGPNYLGAGVMLETIVEVEATLAAATQYRIVVSSATGEDAPWAVGVMTSRGGEGVDALTADWPDGASTYNGDADYAFSNPYVSTIAGDDLAAYLSLALEGPADLTATADSVAFDNAEPCGIDAVPFALLEWTGSGAGAEFARYRLQRRDDVNGEWSDVAYLTAEALVTFSDVEARLAVESEWRLRTEGTTGAVSLWTDVAALTLAAAGCGYTFSTNWLPLDAVGYVDVYDSIAERGYEFGDAAEVQVRTFAGRDEYVMFRPTERRSARFQRRLMVRSFRGPTAGIIGPAAFDALRDLTRATVPYIAVRDERGNRWLAGVIVPSGTVRQPGDHHRAIVDVVPVATIPAAPTIEA